MGGETNTGNWLKKGKTVTQGMGTGKRNLMGDSNRAEGHR